MLEFFQTHTVAAGVSAQVATPGYRHRSALRRPMFALFLALLCSFQISAILHADEDHEAARNAYQQRDFVKAERIWRQLAEQGDVQSQFLLGMLYDQGSDTVAKDDGQASYWFERAASQGHVNAQFNLGNAYMNGRGVPRDHEQAVHWWRQAADNGSPNAQFNLAIQYYQGRGVEKNTDKAIEYFNHAANNGHVRAQELIASNQVPRLEQPADAGMAEEESDVAESAGQVQGPADAEKQSKPPGSESGDPALDWLREQDPRHYTIQLAATGSAEGLDRLVARYSLGDEAVRVRVLREGKTLHYLLMGSFAERHQANLRIESLAPELRTSKPWARPFAELQSLTDYDQ